MTCGGCENRVKGALIECAGVKDAQVNHKDGKAVVQVEKGKANKEKLIEAVEKVGFSASEG
jgi:copper chaperone CopZ